MGQEKKKEMLNLTTIQLNDFNKPAEKNFPFEKLNVKSKIDLKQKYFNFFSLKL